MAVRKNTAAVLDETIEVEAVEATEVAPTEKQIINDAISGMVEALGLDGQKSRYKAMRAIAFQAFSNSIGDGTFDELVAEATANADSLPSGWELERTEKSEVVKPVTKKAPVKAAATKAAPVKKAAATKAAATPAKPAARRRPTR